MKIIIAGTNRPGSRSLEVAHLVQKLYKDQGEETEVLSLTEIPFSEVNGTQYSEKQPPSLAKWIERLDQAEGLIIVCPEYNGSMPGILKYFIDHWKYPVTFEYRPIALIGLGGKFGGLRPVEHLQQVFGYRNAYCFPERVFISNVWNVLKEGTIQDDLTMGLLKKQALGFSKFVKALQSQKLDANSVLKENTK